jgi:hypothetical protein
MVVMTTRGRAIGLVVALALAASLLTLAVVLAKPAQAQAQTFTDTDQEPVSGYTSSCTNDELVFIEGTLHTVAHTTIDANGGYHTTFQFNLKGQGEGLVSGDKYVYNDKFGNQANYSLAPGETYNSTLTYTFKITRQGSASATDDLQTKALFHVTVNENGEVTAVVEKFEIVCT